MSLEPRVQDTASKARGPRKAPMYACAGYILRSSTVHFHVTMVALHQQDLEMRQDLEQMVSEEEQKRLINGVQEGKKKPFWDCYS